MPDKDIFKVEDLPLDAFAASLGLAATPNVRFLHKIKDRTELRSKKNVNRKLQKLKDQIKAEKLAKKIEKMGGKRPREEESAEKDEDDLLVVKTKHTWNEPDDDEKALPDPHLHEATKSRHPKKIRIDGSTGANKRIVFGDDGEEQNVASLLKQDTLEVAKEIQKDRNDLEIANEDYMRKVRERLQSTACDDRAQEKDRIREKHRKRRLQEKADKAEDMEGEAVEVMLGHAETSESESVFSGESETSEDESEEEGEVELKAQEELALAMIRNNAK
jgi:ATP-dependent RNA helicase DDX10/DBP4